MNLKRTFSAAICIAALATAACSDKKNKTANHPQNTGTQSFAIDSKDSTGSAEKFISDSNDDVRTLFANPDARGYLENFIRFSQVRDEPKRTIEAAHVSVDMLKDHFDFFADVKMDLLYKDSSEIKSFTGVGDTRLHKRTKDGQQRDNGPAVETVCSDKNCDVLLIAVKDKPVVQDPVAISTAGRTLMIYNRTSKALTSLVLSGDKKSLSLQNVIVPADALAYREKTRENELNANIAKISEITGYWIFCSKEAKSSCHTIMKDIANFPRLEELKGYYVDNIMIREGGSGMGYRDDLDISKPYIVLSTENTAEQLLKLMQDKAIKNDSDEGLLRKSQVARYKSLISEVEKSVDYKVTILSSGIHFEKSLEGLMKLNAALETLKIRGQIARFDSSKYELAIFLSSRNEFKKDPFTSKGNEFWLHLNASDSSKDMLRNISKSIESLK